MIDATFIAIVGCAIQLFEYKSAFIVGRLIYGLATGVFITAISRMNEEYIPFKWFSVLVNIMPFSFNIGALLASLSAVILPKDSAST